MPNTAATGHLESRDFYDFLEDQVSRARMREIEAHLDGCPECVETLSMIVRSGRPASREEQADLAAVPEPEASEVVARLGPAITGSSASKRSSKGEWIPLLAAASVFLSLATTGWLVYTRGFLPATSRRLAAETMAAIIELRQATGRIPLRYIPDFERASVTRSGFDTEEPSEKALVSNLRAAVERAPEPEAVLTLGLLLLDDGNLDEAESLFQQVLASEPGSVQALNGLAVVYYAKAERDPSSSFRMLQRGLAFLRQAQGFAPEDLQVLYNFGKYYEALDMPPAAALAWRRYLEMDPYSQWAEEAAYQLAQVTPR